MSPAALWPGLPSPLGATWDGEGVNFALFSANAARVDLCLFDSSEDTCECARLALREKTNEVWHGYLPGAAPGQLYGYRVHGPEAGSAAQAFNPNRLLLDPYAKSIAREFRNGEATCDPSLDNAAEVPLARVIDPAFSWNGSTHPAVPWHETILYEVHVKGFTQQHPGVPSALRGTYAGFASPAAIGHLKSLGITAVELLPVHYHIDEASLIKRGLSNYWGYNTLAFFAPDPRYCSSGAENAVNEFKEMVRTLHNSGIEVILDVVYNHTAEGDLDGPTLSMRGIDNESYYRLSADKSQYIDFTGCGNSLNVAHPHVLQLIMDSLRYWVQEMHVDGFRFDLASALARELWDVDRLGSFFDIIHQDPVISRVKLIAEPWDLGPNGYQVGNFPVLWSEWNGRYRDCVRRFWRGEGGTVGELATRLSGSSDLYQHNGRRPHASINFVTCHDGFTLADLVSFNSKHNEANQTGNADGADQNDSWNCGFEGGTVDPAIRKLRARQQRNFLCTLFLSQGVPMLLSGDEFGRSQSGNNNAFCHDSPVSWIDWNLDEERMSQFEFVRLLIDLRRRQPVFRRRHFFQGRAIHGTDIKDLYWIRPDGSEMSEMDWNSPHVRCIGMGLLGDQILECDERGQPVRGDSFLILMNAGGEMVPFRLGSRQLQVAWTLVLDTSDGARPGPSVVFPHMAEYPLQARSIAVLLPHYVPFT
ncbi:MAG: glycogen debranching protein GlgX [bacterium]